MDEKIEWRNSAAIGVATLEDLRLIFSETQERLKDTAESANSVYQKSTSLFTVIIPIMTGIIGYVALNFNRYPVLSINLILIAGMLWISCCLLKGNISLERYRPIGTQPVKLFVDDFFSNLGEEKGKRTPEWYMLFSLIEDYQNRINTNVKQNNIKFIAYNESVNWLYWIPFLSACYWIVTGILGVI